MIVISKSGIIIRISSKEISTMSRYGSGVKIMNIKKEDRVVAISKTEQSRAAEEDEE